MAGHRAAIELKRTAPEASVTLFSAEEGLPYQRPPLSKELLTGRLSARDILLAGTDHYADLGIVYCPGTSITTIDRNRQLANASDGCAHPYDRLLLTTGSRPRILPEHLRSPRINYLRTIDDALAIRAAISSGKRLVVIGGGFLGLEVAAAARSLGCHVTVLEAQSALLSRGMPAVVGEAVLRMHRAEGVEVRLDVNLRGIAEEGGVVSVITEHEELEADAVVAGIGVLPNSELAEEAGLLVEDGIIVDAGCATSDPAIFAAGEVSSHPNYAGRLCRQESWKVAMDQPLVAARNMLGGKYRYSNAPWLWSDQFGMNLQVLGHPDAADHFIIHGDTAGDQWCLIALDEQDLPVGVVAFNSGRDVSMLRNYVQSRRPLPDSYLHPAAKMELAAKQAAGSDQAEGRGP